MFFSSPAFQSSRIFKWEAIQQPPCLTHFSDSSYARLSSVDSATICLKGLIHSSYWPLHILLQVFSKITLLSGISGLLPNSGWIKAIVFCVLGSRLCCHSYSGLALSFLSLNQDPLSAFEISSGTVQNSIVNKHAVVSLSSVSINSSFLFSNICRSHYVWEARPVSTSGP